MRAGTHARTQPRQRTVCGEEEEGGRRRNQNSSSIYLTSLPHRRQSKQAPEAAGGTDGRSMRVTERLQNSVSCARPATLRLSLALFLLLRVTGSADSVADFQGHFMKSPRCLDGETAALSAARILSLRSE